VLELVSLGQGSRACAGVTVAARMVKRRNIGGFPSGISNTLVLPMAQIVERWSGQDEVV
jgi:hypothetical protein